MKKVTEDYESLNFNTAISQMMIFINDVYKLGKVNRDMFVSFIRLLYPIAPHVCEEMNQMITGEADMSYNAWPTADESKLVVNTVKMAVQINGKLRTTIEVNKDEDKKVIESIALQQEAVQRNLEGLEVKKVIVVPGKIVNIVAK